MKIVNMKKFIKMIGIIIGLTIALSFYFTNNSYSKGEAKTKNIYVSSGDTLWSIASFEQENNAYYQNKDIREIIYEIKEVNNLKNTSNLSIGQKLEIYTI